MTQVFDPESGEVTAVTVIEAGPCPVVQVKTVETDGYEAVQIAFDEVAERKISKAEQGASREGGRLGAPPPRRVPRPEPAAGRRGRHGRGVRARREGQGRRDLDRQGLPGHDQAAQLPPRPRLARLAQRPQAGLDRRVGDPVPRLQGPEDGRPDGRRPHHAAGPRHPPDRSRAQPAPRQGLRARSEERHRRDQGGEVMAAPKAKLVGGSAAKDVTLDAEIFGADVKPHLLHETVRAELNARRAGTRGAKTRGLVSGGRAKPWRQKGTGRARAGTIRAAQFTGGGVVFAPTMRSFDVKVNRKARRSALRGALSQPRLERHARRARRLRLRGAVDEAGQGPRRVVGQGAAAPDRRDRGGGDADQVVPQPPEVARDGAVRARGRHDRLGAERPRSPRPRCRSSRGGLPDEPPPERGAARSGRLGEELQPDHRPQVHVQGAQGRAQDADPAGRRGAVRGPRREREHHQGAGEAEAARHVQGHAPRLEEGHRAGARGRRRSRSSRGPRSKPWH